MTRGSVRARTDVLQAALVVVPVVPLELHPHLRRVTPAQHLETILQVAFHLHLAEPVFVAISARVMPYVRSIRQVRWTGKSGLSRPPLERRLTGLGFHGSSPA